LAIEPAISLTNCHFTCTGVEFVMPLFTTATAREMAARSHAARLKRTTQREAARVVAPGFPQAKPQQDDDALFIAKRLARVRKQLDRIDGMIEKEIDPMKLDRLASAQARLAEQERILAGRPMPGSLRPKKPPEQARPYCKVSPISPIKPTVVADGVAQLSNA
jgi:hypothetical protein